MRRFHIQIKTIKPLAGGMPAVPEFLRGKIARDIVVNGHKSKVAVELGNGDFNKALTFLVDTNYQDIVQAIKNYPKEIIENLTVFRRDNEGRLFLKDYNVKAFIKEVAINVLGFRRAEAKEKIKHGIAVYPEVIYIYKEVSGELVPCTSNDVLLKEIAGHVVTNRGPRSIIKYSEVLLPPKYIEFDVVVMEDHKGKPVVSEKDLKKIFEEGGKVNGLLSNRSLGFGRFELVKFEEVKND